MTYSQHPRGINSGPPLPPGLFDHFEAATFSRAGETARDGVGCSPLQQSAFSWTWPNAIERKSKERKGLKGVGLGLKTRTWHLRREGRPEIWPNTSRNRTVREQCLEIHFSLSIFMFPIVFLWVLLWELTDYTVLTHCGPVTQICVCTLQMCKTDDANLRF